jgi:hypothetical protein
MNCKNRKLSTMAFMLFTAAAAWGAPAEPLVRLTGIKGACQVKKPEFATFGEAKEGKAYHYGSSFMTGPDSSAVVQFSAGNDCLMQENTRLRVLKAPDDPTIRIIELQKGDIEVTIEETWRETNALHIEHGLSICEVQQGRLLAEAQAIDGLRVVSYECKLGTARVFGPHYDIPVLGEGTAVDAANSVDRTFNRLRGVKSRIEVHVRDAEGGEKVVERAPGEVVKIWQSRTPIADEIAVTILITPPSAGAQGEGVDFELIEYREPFDPQALRLTMESAGAVMQDGQARKNDKTGWERPTTPGMPAWLDEL